MDQRIDIARPGVRAFALAAATTMLSALMSATAMSQTPPPPAPPKAAAPKAAPKAQAKPPAEAAPQGQAQQQANGGLQLVYSPWTKLCQKGPEANAKQICFTGKEGRLEDGRPIVSAMIVEQEGEARKILRVMAPIGVVLQPGSRVIVDEGQPMNGPYLMCQPTGCFSDYEASGELIAKLKKGSGLFIQAIQATNGQPLTLGLPLQDFAKAYDGPSIDPKVWEDQQKKLQDELNRRAEDARKKLQAPQAAPQAARP
jgi:invasion protein IalB